MERDINEFNLTIGGEQIEQIEVRLLTQTLMKVESVMSDINAQIGTNRTFQLAVRTYKPGSFDIYLTVLSDMTTLGIVSGLVNASNLQTAKQIIDYFSAVLSVKKFLRGNKPSSVKNIEGNNLEIKNNYGQVLVVNELTVNLSSSESIDKGISELFTTLKRMPYVDRLTIKDKDEGELFVALKPQNDFNNLIEGNPLMKLEDSEPTKEKTVDAILSVFSIIFTDTRKWEFFYEGNKIPVTLKDPDFLDNVMSRRIRFANGDRLRCKMEIHQVYNQVAQVYENKSYSILKVVDILPPEAQTGLAL